MTSRWDVVIAGAGPAGSAAATLLATAGHRVLVVDKQEFPRFQIGESLLPVCLPILERLGVSADPDSHVFKRGAEFVCETTGRRTLFDFSQALPGSPRHAWHVERARFDVALRDAARRAGATVVHGVTLAGVELGEDSVTVLGRGEGPWTCRYFVDATGQNRLMARQLRSVEPFEGFGRIASFAHFDGLSDDAIAEIGPGGDIRILVVDGGWGWLIPLPHRRLSVGLVLRCSEGDAEFERHAERSDLIRRWSRGARRSAIRRARNFSFRNTRPHGPRYACVGDAACFLDPLFSSGVSLGLVAAERMVERLEPALRADMEGDPELMAPHQSEMEVGYRAFSRMIDRFYHTRFVDHLIFGDSPSSEIKRGVVSVLAGDVWRDDNPFQEMLMRSRRRASPEDPQTDASF